MPAQDESLVVSSSVDNGVAILTVDNPPVNALSRAVRVQLLAAIRSAMADASVRGVVIRCAGRTFIAGADVTEFGKPPEPPSLPDDAVWVGWGFVAEDIAFAELCARLKLTFIGPPPAAMRTLGDKVEAKLLAEKVGVPLAPWSGGPVETREDARRHAEAIGYPLIIKARSGGGGRGIRKVFSPDELEVALERTQGEAERSFGDPVVFLERLVTDARHVEVQVIADNHGNVWAPGVRDCSIQRRNQKVIEESSSPLLTKEQADHLRSVSAELVRAAGYRGAGTVEFLYQPDQKVFTFLEVNTRLQVEHPITEVTTGLDLVKLQIFVASGGALEGECPPELGHAVEARLNAEDADNDFAPAPGTVRLLKFPLGSGIRPSSRSSRRRPGRPSRSGSASRDARSPGRATTIVHVQRRHEQPAAAEREAAVGDDPEVAEDGDVVRRPAPLDRALGRVERPGVVVVRRHVEDAVLDDRVRLLAAPDARVDRAEVDGVDPRELARRCPA